MPNTAQSPVQERVEDGIDLVELYFDLEQASLPCESDLGDSQATPDFEEGNNNNNNNNDTEAGLPGFIPITGKKEDPYMKWLAEALKRENELGGKGPFIYHHSPNVFMGSIVGFREQPVREKADVTHQKPLADNTRKLPTPVVAPRLQTYRYAVYR
ncbi:hypothetical protein SAMD00023353_5900090 [Rosellinia necatrix]|uniref:Uncharacterized protein n=1 Tax=Rosellinia necatrix TaxID=77044 RepID=A0A1W2TVI8_ROSNE|nr:hypothetical protein SAMD00023353_5900090 [Rosellinia necatrix]